MTITGKVPIVTGGNYLIATTIFADSGLMHSSPGL
jgi:hypothetical protein